MSQANEFLQLVERVRRGEATAAAEVVRRFEPEVRRFIHFRLTSPTVRRFVDSLDICQSVLARFFVHLSAGELDLAEPRQLQALLLKMARNRIYDAVGAQHAGRRDARRVLGGGHEALAAIAQGDDSPSQLLAAEEIVAAVRGALAADDRYLVDQRMAGREWSDLAAEIQTTPEAVRKRVTRALDQAAETLGLRRD